ncbi:MAG: DUF2877 domain-containing protein [Pseudomonadota bacterium]
MLPATIDHLREYRIRSCGGAGYQLLANGCFGAVVAVFDKSFYFEVGGKLACVVPHDVPDGPMHLVVDLPTSLSWKSVGLEVGAPVRVTNNRVVVGRALSFDARFMKVWRPEARPVAWTVASLSRGILGLKQIARSRLRRNSLDLYPEPDCVNPAIVGLLAAFLCAKDFELEEPDIELKDLAAFVGLGGGLTPSGDDFLGGVMIALHAMGFVAACTAVWSVVGPVAEQTTNRISFEHLSYASQGQTIEPLEKLKHATLAGRIEEILALAEEVSRVGHTSGWDIVSGMLCGFEAAENAM